MHTICSCFFLLGVFLDFAIPLNQSELCILRWFRISVLFGYLWFKTHLRFHPRLAFSRTFSFSSLSLSICTYIRRLTVYTFCSHDDCGELFFVIETAADDSLRKYFPPSSHEKGVVSSSPFARPVRVKFKWSRLGMHTTSFCRVSDSLSSDG